MFLQFLSINIIITLFVDIVDIRYFLPDDQVIVAQNCDLDITKL